MATRMSFPALCFLLERILETKARVEADEQRERDAQRLAEVFGSDRIEPVNFDLQPVGAGQSVS